MHTLDKVYAAAKAGHVRQNGHNVMVYHRRADGHVDIECGFEAAAAFEPVGEVFYCETPTGLAVTATHIGPYQQLGVTHEAIVNWSRNNGYRVTGTCWEIYGDWDADAAKLRTDVFHLVTRQTCDAV